ncbi:MAG: FAD-linked oxidase C-terminal domain-containing protein [Pseudomonadota bacterium]
MTTKGKIGDSALARRLAGALQGEVLFDAFSRGRYATDASIYQIEPIGVVVPRGLDDVAATLEIVAEQGLPLLPRGGGTSQCGQTVGEAIVVDVSKFMDKIRDFDPESRRVTVEPGLVLARLNAFLKPHGLFFPVDVSTANRATLGGMTGNNSCGARSIRYGPMRDSVLAVDAILADGTRCRFAETPDQGSAPADLTTALSALGRREAAEIAARFPKLQRRVGGYNIDALAGNSPPNLAQLLVGSEGTLAFSHAIELALQPIPPAKVLGVCHFPTFYQAMDATRHIVALEPAAVELVDRTMVELARDIPLFRPTLEAFVRGDPAALLLVEFAGEETAAQLAKLKQLTELMADLGFPGAVVEATDEGFQKAIWEVRKAGLNIMMSMKGDGKPVSFIEDCAVVLEDLADYTDRLTKIFHKHGTEGTWYAHASVGCLHVRPILNMKQEAGATTMRAIAEEAFAMVRDYKGSHSGEHGDGLVRSEFHEPMFGQRMVKAFEEVKAAFDPNGLFNPGKIVKPAKMDDRSLFRFKPGYKTEDLDTALDWSDWGGFAGAVEMCNNNGACRKFDAGVMCPSFRVTRDEQHVTRGRANALRLALSGQLGANALASEEMAEALKLCVGCKACKRECPTGVDMARMKTEALYQRNKIRPPGLRERLIAHTPRLASFGPLLNLRDQIPGVAGMSERWLGLSAQRRLPKWRRPYRPAGLGEGRQVVLLPDCFNGNFEPENLEAAERVLAAAGYKVVVPAASGRPLCCGRTYLAAGLVEQARAEARRTIDALAPYAAQGLAVVGLEPSCLLTLKDEFKALFPGEETDDLADRAQLLEAFLANEEAALDLKPLAARHALLHGHCHQKAFGVMASVTETLARIPELAVQSIESGCCGMAGAFGYQAETYEVSRRMAELDLAPAVRAAPDDTLVIADGFSCRHQIADVTGRRALHSARVLDQALASGGTDYG